MKIAVSIPVLNSSRGSESISASSITFGYLIAFFALGSWSGNVSSLLSNDDIVLMGESKRFWLCRLNSAQWERYWDHIRFHRTGLRRVVKLKVIVDCDPGIDDALALAVLAASPEFDLRAVTTVRGNVSVELSTRNAIRTLAAFGRPDVPVCQGAARPLVRLNPAYPPIHGADGLGDVELPAAPRRRRRSPHLPRSSGCWSRRRRARSQ